MAIVIIYYYAGNATGENMDMIENLIKRNGACAEQLSGTIDDRDVIAAGAAHESTCYAFLTAAHECVELAARFSDEGNEEVIYGIKTRLASILNDIYREREVNL